MCTSLCLFFVCPDGNDLHHTMHITLKEALLGFSKTVMQLDQSEVVVERTEITKPFEVLTMKGDGMPHFEFPSERGDMLVKVNGFICIYYNG